MLENPKQLKILEKDEIFENILKEIRDFSKSLDASCSHQKTNSLVTPKNKVSFEVQDYKDSCNYNIVSTNLTTQSNFTEKTQYLKL